MQSGRVARMQTNELVGCFSAFVLLMMLFCAHAAVGHSDPAVYGSFHVFMYAQFHYVSRSHLIFASFAISPAFFFFLFFPISLDFPNFILRTARILLSRRGRGALESARSLSCSIPHRIERVREERTRAGQRSTTGTSTHSLLLKPRQKKTLPTRPSSSAAVPGGARRAFRHSHLCRNSSICGCASRSRPRALRSRPLPDSLLLVPASLLSPPPVPVPVPPLPVFFSRSRPARKLSVSRPLTSPRPARLGARDGAASQPLRAPRLPPLAAATTFCGRATSFWRSLIRFPPSRSISPRRADRLGRGFGVGTTHVSRVVRVPGLFVPLL